MSWMIGFQYNSTINGHQADILNSRQKFIITTPEYKCMQSTWEIQSVRNIHDCAQMALVNNWALIQYKDAILPV